MKIINLVRALGAIFPGLVVACLTSQSAYRNLSISEFAEAVAYQQIGNAGAGTALFSIAPSLRIAEKKLHQQLVDASHSDNFFGPEIAARNKSSAHFELTSTGFDHCIGRTLFHDSGRLCPEEDIVSARNGALQEIDYIQKKHTYNNDHPPFGTDAPTAYHTVFTVQPAPEFSGSWA
ncbi:MAG: hypothetical protein WA987_10220 [Cellvibrio sp.]